MDLTPQQAINQCEELILDFCQELPEEEQFELEEKNLFLIKEIIMSLFLKLYGTHHAKAG